MQMRGKESLFSISRMQLSLCKDNAKRGKESTLQKINTMAPACRDASIIYMICRYIKTMARACNDTKSCVSRSIHCKVRTLLRTVLQCGFQSGDARFCVSTQARAMIITGMSHVRQSSYSLCRSVPAAFMTYCTSMRAVSISMV